jgi:hypothetical protein
MRRSPFALLSCLISLGVSPSAAFWSTESGGVATDGERKEEAASIETVPYGVDVSFPIHHATISNNYAWLPHNLDPSIPVPDEYKNMPVTPLPGVQARYEEFINGCVQKFGSRGQACLQTEQDRIEMSLRQPQSMQNYTKLGFKKIKTPQKLWNLLETFWKANKDKATLEKWGVGNTYSKYWRDGLCNNKYEEDAVLLTYVMFGASSFRS